VNVICRHCGEGDAVASLDNYHGTCAGRIEVSPSGELGFEPGGYTRIAWDTCEQLGWLCLDCGATELIVDEQGLRRSLDEALAELVQVEDGEGDDE
jgi:hypothetical protein